MKTSPSSAAVALPIGRYRWDIAERLQIALREEGLGHLSLQTPVAMLSGGECTRVALLGVFLSGADLLILDEPSNHLDHLSRQHLYRRLQQWPAGLLVISHDRELLEDMQRIVELSPGGLRAYGGNYSVYRDCLLRERQGAQRTLEHARTERKRGERALQAQQQRQQRRAASGARGAGDSNQAQMLLDRQKNRSEARAVIGRRLAGYRTVRPRRLAITGHINNEGKISLYAFYIWLTYGQGGVPRACPDPAWSDQ